MASKSNSRKVAFSGKHDRISELPEPIISEILSLLPTKEAVATCVLSKRWQYLWTSIKNFDFCCCDYSKKAAFVEFVDRVLSKCTTQKLNKFYLDSKYAQCQVHKWVNQAVARNVKILNLNVPNLTDSVLTCTSLTSLELKLIYSCVHPIVKLEDILNVPDPFYLPNLKVLRISFNISSFAIAQKLVSNSPALEDLAIKASIYQSSFVISPPFLKRLSLKWCAMVRESEVLIDAPKLQYLNIISSGLIPSFEIKNVDPEAKVIIDLRHEVADIETRYTLHLLNQLTGVKSVTLASQTLRVLGSAIPKTLPIFNKLTLLELVMGPFYGSKIIFDLLQASPNLEVFIVKMDYRLIHWIQPQQVPPCLSGLQLVELYCEFKKEFKQELEMVKYLLGNGKVLKKLLVKASHVNNKVDLCNKLLAFSSASRYCEVQVM